MRAAGIAATMLCLGAARAQGCVPDTTPDWMAAASSPVVVWPADCASVAQTPPDFRWPDLSPDSSYQVTLTYPGGATRTLAAALNWINWDEALPAGNYQWQVEVTNGAGVQQGLARRFSVAQDAVPFLVPDWSTLFARAAAKPHPRALPDAATAQLMVAQRQSALQALLARVDSGLADPLPADPLPGPAAAIATLATEECKRALEAALAWLVSLREEHFLEALRRAQNLASWDPAGATSHASVDDASRPIAATLALAYDWLFPRLDAAQKAALLAPALARAADMYDDVIGGRPRISVQPYDSHGNQTLVYLALISVLLAGDIPEAWIGVRDALALAIHWTSPWGGEDGGFANGTAYASWNTGDLLIPWYALRWITEVDLGQKAWVRNYARFLAYFLPPGTPAGAFGDGAELALSENWARFGKAHALFSPGPLARWYASQLTGEDPARLELLLAPPASGLPATFPAGTPDGALFASIGWSAMHSSLQDPARVSIYFKSSPYGSYNHSHADQNSFVVNSGGRRLAIDSGYLDGYGTVHWNLWYKQTRAHNAITYDGGQGQVIFEHGSGLGPGSVTRFENQPQYAIVAGDARAAYGGALGEAYRALAYLRPNVAVVYDRLASAVPRQWEWNIHALDSMSLLTERRISIPGDGQSLCVEMLAGPATGFAQSTAFTGEPAGDPPPQWHGRFTSVAASTAAEFVALLDVGCAAGAASAVKNGDTWTVSIGSRAVTIAGNGDISVSP